MLQKHRAQYLLIFLVILLASCSKSLLYSPSVNLTATSLKEKQIDLQGGIEMLPEARPDALGGNPTTIGAHTQITYGFSDRFNLGIKAWADLEGRENSLRSGYSLNGQFIKELTPQTRLIILPRIGIALDGSSIEGYGVSTSAIYQQTWSDKLSWYGGAGALWGFRYLEKDRNAMGVEKLPMGIAAIGHLGLGWQIAPSFRLNAEVNPIYQLNTFEDKSHILVSPTLGIGYTINR